MTETVEDIVGKYEAIQIGISPSILINFRKHRYHNPVGPLNYVWVALMRPEDYLTLPDRPDFQEIKHLVKSLHYYADMPVIPVRFGSPRMIRLSEQDLHNLEGSMK